MAQIDHTQDALADRYADAIVGLAEQHGQADAVLDGLQGLMALMSADEGLDEALRSPAVDPDVRARAIEKACRGKFPEVLVNALQVINRKGRMSLLPVIAERYRLALEELRNEVDVYVTSAVPLTKEMQAQVVAGVSKAISGRTPRLIEQVDPSLLAGVVIQIGDRKFDGSVSRRLKRLSEKLHLRAVHEIHRTSEHVEVR
jgi:F-type H+-transporting ATPase subunit delta